MKGHAMFELEVMTPIRLVDVVVLSQKNRAPDEDPGAKLTLSVDVPNDALSMFDGRWLSALYTKNAEGASTVVQMPLEGVVPVSDAPDLTNIGQHVPRIAWSDVCTGYALTLDVGGRAPLAIVNCTASAWRIFPKSGGTITVKFNVESNDVSEHAFGKLAKCKSREIRATLLQAREGEAQAEIEPQSEPAEPAAGKRKRAPRSLAQKVARATREGKKAAAS
jgi:hypothetical protein